MDNGAVRRTVQSYDRITEEYAAKWFDKPVMEPYRFISLVQGRGWVADVGCGPGRDPAYLLKHGVPTIGIDLSMNMLEEARRRVPEGTYILADCRQLPFRTNSLAGIWACASLLHLPRSDFARALSEFARVLHRGHLFLGLKEGDGEQWTRGTDGSDRFFTYYRPSEIESALGRAGFELGSTHTQNRLNHYEKPCFGDSHSYRSHDLHRQYLPFTHGRRALAYPAYTRRSG